MAEQAETPDETGVGASDLVSESDPQHEVVRDHLETVRVRRSPKYSVFLAAGAALGLVVAMILTVAFDGVDEVSPNTGLIYSQTQVFGFLALICIVIGVVVGALVALILDRVLARRSREVTVDRESIRIEE